MAFRVPIKSLPSLLERLTRHLPNSIAEILGHCYQHEKKQHLQGDNLDFVHDAVKVGPLLKGKRKFENIAKAYSAVELITRGLTGYEVYVDKWPEIGAVVVVPDNEAMQSSCHERCVFLFSDNNTSIMKPMEESGLLKLPLIAPMFIWADGVYEKLKDMISKSNDPPFMQLFFDSAEVFYTNRDLISKIPDLPDQFTPRRLKPGDTKTVLSGLWYKENEFSKSVKRVLEVEALSIGVENEKGELVAWSVQHVAGFLGMTFVKPNFRNIKLGKYVTIALAKKITEKDGICLSAVEESNPVSVNLHEKAGFKKLDKVVYWVAFKAKGSKIVINEKNHSTKNWKE